MSLFDLKYIGDLNLNVVINLFICDLRLNPDGFRRKYTFSRSKINRNSAFPQ